MRDILLIRAKLEENNSDRPGRLRIQLYLFEGKGEEKKRRRWYSVLKPLDFILCTLCRGDDLLGDRGSKKKKKGKGEGIGDAERKVPLGIF